MGALELQKGMPLTQRLRRVEVAHPFDAIDYPALPSKPRASALTSVLDRGASVLEAQDRIAVAGEWIYVVKLGWATARLTPAAP
jgi:phosphosulfolactate synthase (CoM biosynthesis protein A)